MHPAWILLKPSRTFTYDLQRFAVNIGDVKKLYEDLSPKPLYTWRVLLKDDYPVMSKLALSLLSVGFSSVPVERLFSKLLKDFKPWKRNRLNVEHLEACLLIEQEGKDDFLVSEDMLSRRNDM